MKIKISVSQILQTFFINNISFISIIFTKTEITSSIFSMNSSDWLTQSCSSINLKNKSNSQININISKKRQRNTSIVKTNGKTEQTQKPISNHLDYIHQISNVKWWLEITNATQKNDQLIYIINQSYSIIISDITVTITTEIARLKIKIDNLTNNMIKQNFFNITRTMSQMYIQINLTNNLIKQNFFNNFVNHHHQTWWQEDDWISYSACLDFSNKPTFTSIDLVLMKWQPIGKNPPTPPRDRAKPTR